MPWDNLRDDVEEEFRRLGGVFDSYNRGYAAAQLQHLFIGSRDTRPLIGSEPCPICGGVVPRSQAKRPGANRVYCSLKCQWKRESLQRTAKRKANPVVRVCRQCKKSFMIGSANQQLCSRICKRIYRKRYNATYQEKRNR